MDPNEYYKIYTEIIDQLEREGWMLLRKPTTFRCGWCATTVAPDICLIKPSPSESSRVVYLCVDCKMPTAFVDTGRDVIQYPAPPVGKMLPRHQDADVQLIVDLYHEARQSIKSDAPSCAVLMFRKILMHIAVNRGAGKDRKFIEYCDHLKTNGDVSTPMQPMLDRIRKAGNTENHEVSRATSDQAKDLLTMTEHLIRTIYFTD